MPLAAHRDVSYRDLGPDVLAHVTKGIGGATGEDFAPPDAGVGQPGKLGDKTGGGFYTKTLRERSRTTEAGLRQQARGR
jgi:3-hydroxyacyl-CoA dehydrogenase